MNQVIFHSEDIECDGCATTIKQVLGNLAGIKSVDVNVELKNVNVTFEPPLNQELIISALSGAGFEVSD